MILEFPSEVINESLSIDNADSSKVTGITSC